MKSLLTIILTVIFGISYSQNYSLLSTNRQCLFNDGNYCLRIDSIATSNGDTSYFNYKQISLRYNHTPICHSYSNNSWLGKKVIRKTNNDWEFILLSNDTFIIKPTLSVGSKWFAGNIFSASDTARIDSVYQLTFLGITDSVKSITVFGCTNSVYCFNKILISKNYGLIKFFDLGNNSTTLTLAGITNPDVGLQNLNGSDIYDFQAGDEYHTIYENTTSIFPLQNFVQYTQHNIISSEIVGSNLVVKDSVYMININTNSSTQGLNYSISDTSIILNGTNSISSFTKFDKLSFEHTNLSFNCGNSSDSCINAYIQGVTDVFQTKTTYYYGLFPEGINITQTCNYEDMLSGYVHHFYAKKMGGPYFYKLPNWAAGLGSEYYPVYHKRGNVEEGTPIDFLSILLGIENKQNDSSINIYPNPANDIITISNNTSFKEIEIYNSVGLLVLKTQLRQINISNLASGFYHIKIIKNDNTFVEKRLVKQ